MRKMMLGMAGAALVLGGCGQAADKVAEKAAEKIVEQGTGGDVDFEKDGSFTVKDKDGNEFSIGKKELPTDWPEVLELPDGAQINSSASGGGMSTVTYDLADGSPESAVAFHAKRLEDAGYTRTMESTMADSALSAFEKEGETGPGANVSVQASPSSTGSGVSVVVIAGQP